MVQVFMIIVLWRDSAMRVNKDEYELAGTILK
jgi:hypothetical protein